MNKSFTLIEILIVIVVIGVLSAFVLVGMSSITSSANTAKSKAFSNSLRNSLLNNLVSEWRLDGNANDSWGANNGTWSGPTGSNTTANWRPESECIFGQCLHFDGTDDSVNCGTGATLNIREAITLSIWVKFDFGSLGTVDRYLIKQPGHAFRYYYPTDLLTFTIYTDQGNYYCEKTGHGFNDYKWHYVVATYDKNDGSNNQKTYIDGILFKSSTGAGNLNAVTYTYIGSSVSAGYFKGLIDDARIYSQALPTSKIEQNYFSGLNNLYRNKGLAKIEYNEKLTALKINLANNE